MWEIISSDIGVFLRHAREGGTRRQFILISTAATLQLMMGCAPKKTTVDDKPMHHLTKGFRNYPLAPEPATTGISFLFRRIRESYDKPEIPKGHVMEEAILVANDVKADLIIPSHWGTIALTDEPTFEPPDRYQAYANTNGISDRRASIMKIGETRII